MTYLASLESASSGSSSAMLIAVTEWVCCVAVRGNVHRGCVSGVCMRESAAGSSSAMLIAVTEWVCIHEKAVKIRKIMCGNYERLCIRKVRVDGCS